MSKYVVTYTPDGKVKEELIYKNEIFSFTMIPNGYGKTGDNKIFKLQVLDKFPNEPEEVIDALDNLTFSNDEEVIEESLIVLSANEIQ